MTLEKWIPNEIKESTWITITSYTRTNTNLHKDLDVKICKIHLEMIGEKQDWVTLEHAGKTLGKCGIRMCYLLFIQ